MRSRALTLRSARESSKAPPSSAASCRALAVMYYQFALEEDQPACRIFSMSVAGIRCRIIALRVTVHVGGTPRQSWLMVEGAACGPSVRRRRLSAMCPAVPSARSF